MELPKFGDFSFKSITQSDLDLFTCDSILEKYFKSDAIDTENELIAKTYFLFKQGILEPLVGFSVSNHSLSANIEINQLIPYGSHYKTYPAVLIGRLATHNNHLRNGYARLTIDIIKAWFTTSNKTGCRFIIVDARKDAVDFYKKNGFEEYPAEMETNQNILLYFDLMDYLIQQNKLLNR
ncbi:GNAT family N-acetyltransferase [Leptospira perolatii]|uniref:GNAT family N-acetyltransferase n=1 Tax=Leptospira perolatii TaxID=2023191 RepID=A0A2M9ZME6_9LEPT|nr:GNAT family N-acetyltransferase [Leptospira perolatii]PJZ70062.1 GNAT family N-acetyltransferase [Leptospira perolatii]PJZ73250.1 GNAT family N-acetyltransferase [Leptospira perolatii]